MDTLADSRLTSVAGLALLAGAVLSIVFMLHHPSPGTHELGGMLGELEHQATISAWVHGLLILVLMGIWFGTYALTRLLGSSRVLPVLGFMFFSMGVLGYVLAAMVSGFIVLGFIGDYVGAEAEQMLHAQALLRASWATNQAFANAALVGTSIGIVCWSVMLTLRQGIIRAVGVLGLVSGIVPIVLLFSGHLQLHVAGMTTVVVINSIWYAAVGALMTWGPLKTAE